MRVVMLVTNPFKPDPRVYKEAKSLVNAGHEVIVLAWDREGKYPREETVEGIRVVRFGPKSRYGSFFDFLVKLPVFYIKAFIFMAKKDFDAIHTHDFDTAFLGLLFKYIKGKKWVYDVHDLYESFVQSMIVKMLIQKIDSYFIRMADVVITVNYEMTRILSQRARPKEALVVFNTVNPLKMIVKKGKGFTVFYGGVLSRGRFIEEISKIARELGVELRVAGGGVLENIIRESGAIFLGYLPHDKALRELARAHLTFILYDPSVLNNRIASPNKLFEAMCLKTPVLVVKGTLPEKLAEKFVVPVEYSEEDVKRTLEYLRDNPKIIRKKGHLGRKIFLKNYTWDVMEKRLLKLYSEVLK